MNGRGVILGAGTKLPIHLDQQLFAICAKLRPHPQVKSDMEQELVHQSVRTEAVERSAGHYCRTCIYTPTGDCLPSEK